MSPHARVAAPGTWRGRSTTPRRARAGRSGRESRRSRRHQLPQLLEPRRSDAGDGVEVVDRAEGAVLLAVMDDLLCRYRPDSRELVELLDGRGVQVNRPCRRRLLTGARRPRLRRSNAFRDDDLRPVRDRRGEVDEAQIGASGRSPGTAQRIRDPRPVGESVEPRAPDGADDVDDEPRPRLSPQLAGARGRGRPRFPRRADAGEVAAAQEERGDEQESARERTPARERGEVHAPEAREEGVTCGKRLCADCVPTGVTPTVPVAYTECVSELANAHRSFASAAEEHLDDVYRYLLYVTANPATAEDLTSETFERALRRWSRFDPRRGSAQTWLCQLARSTALDHFRAEDRRRRREQRVAEPDRGADLELPDEYGPVLRQALRTLTGAEREVIALRVVLELDTEHAARVLGISPSACTTRLNRALAKLEKKVRPRLVA